MFTHIYAYIYSHLAYIHVLIQFVYFLCRKCWRRGIFEVGYFSSSNVTIVMVVLSLLFNNLLIIFNHFSNVSNMSLICNGSGVWSSILLIHSTSEVMFWFGWLVSAFIYADKVIWIPIFIGVVSVFIVDCLQYFVIFF